MSLTDALLVVLLVEIAVMAYGWRQSINRLHQAVLDVDMPEWQMLPFTVQGKPDCGHESIAARHASGATACAECAKGGR